MNYQNIFKLIVLITTYFTATACSDRMINVVPDKSATQFEADVQNRTANSNKHYFEKKCTTASDYAVCNNVSNITHDESTDTYTMIKTNADGSVQTSVFSLTTTSSDGDDTYNVYKETSRTITCPNGTSKTYSPYGNTGAITTTNQKGETCVMM